MPSLTFYRGNKPAMRRELGGAQVIIGRDDSSDIQLLDDDISRIHATISLEGVSYIITDKSTNGTTVNGKQIQRHILQDNDTITIGEWKIVFEKRSATSRVDTVVRENHPTKILKFEPAKKLLISESIELTITRPNGKKDNLITTSATMGSVPDCDIIITDDPYISGHHCAIKCTDGGFILEDMGSKNRIIYNN